MTKIVIADHHPITRFGIISHLCMEGNQYSVIGEVAHGNKLMDVIKKKKPCLLLMELNMPGIEGFQILKDINHDFPKTKIIVFSSYPDEIYAHHCIRSGASGYINKTTTAKEFEKIISSVMRGKTYIPKSLQSNKKTRKEGELRKNLFQKLSSRETEVLNLLLTGKRNKDIAIDLNINEKTVSTYKSRLLKKLEIQNLAELINHINAISF